MIFGIIGMIIGITVAAFSVYLLVKNKDDVESKKIYGTACGIGAVVFAVALIKLILAV